MKDEKIDEIGYIGRGLLVKALGLIGISMLILGIIALFYNTGGGIFLTLLGIVCLIASRYFKREMVHLTKVG
jgi:hypothetical protein